MSNLALSAAPFSSNNEDNNMSSISRLSNNHIARVRNRTIKNHNTEDKVNEMMSYIHKNANNNDDDSDLNNFNPPSPPTSIGAEKRKETDPNLSVNKELKEGEMSQSNLSELENDKAIDKNVYDELPNQNIHLNQQINQHEYYEKVVPLYKQLNETSGVSQFTNKNELTQKLNYMIHLLEEQQDERTGHVFEELILYSFLGIFIIFVVDSFARAGKYVR